MALIPLFLLPGCNILPDMPKKEEVKPIFEKEDSKDLKNVPAQFEQSSTEQKSIDEKTHA